MRARSPRDGECEISLVLDIVHLSRNFLENGDCLNGVRYATLGVFAAFAKATLGEQRKAKKTPINLSPATDLDGTLACGERFRDPFAFFEQINSVHPSTRQI